MSNSQDSHYLSLLGLAEKFRTEDPPNVRACVQCLQAVLKFDPPPKVAGRTHLQLGNLLLHYTKNVELAQSHLEQAWTLCLNIPGFDDVKYEAALKLSKLYDQIDSLSSAKNTLNQALEMSHSNVNWHCALLLQNAQISLKQKDLNTSANLLQMGFEYSHMQGHSYNQNLFNLSRLMVSLLENKPAAEVQSLLNVANQNVEQFNGPPFQKEHLKVYYLILLVCHSLNIGQVKSVKPTLKLLQQSIQTFTEQCNNDTQVINNPELLVLLPKDQLCILVYLVSVMHSVQAGYMDKAHKYIDKALVQISKLKGNSDYTKFLDLLEVLLIEHSVMSHLITGAKSNAIKDISKLSICLQQSPAIKKKYEAQLHILLAIYSMSMDNKEAAEKQFNSALKKAENQDVGSFANLNLAMVYLNWDNEKDLTAIMERIQPESLVTHSHSLRAAAYYVQGLHAFNTNRLDHGKLYLRESLKMANAEDLNRLTSCSLVLLGHIFLALSSHREASNMVTPAMQLASKIPDLHLQLWASAILEVIYRHVGDSTQEQEQKNSHDNFSQILSTDHKSAIQLPEHNLISWTDGPLPKIA